MTPSDASVFQYKPLLFSIAYEFLGNLKDAEDAVQDTYLRWFERDTSQVEKIKPYLVATLKNICFDWSKQTNRFWEMQKEMMERAPAKEDFIPAYILDFEMDKELWKAYQTMTSMLNISEKSVFLLREIFNFEYQDISSIIGKKSENCRKILDRAKKRLAEKSARFYVETEQSAASFADFKDACQKGKVNEFVISLQKEIKDKKN